MATVFRGVIANLPFAVAPGMGLNVFFVALVTSNILSFQGALTAVLVSGALFVFLSLSPLREKVLKEVPKSLQYAVACGLGLMIAHIGLFKCGLVVSLPPKGQYNLGDITHGAGLLAMIGFLATGVLLAFKVRFSLLLGIIITTIIGIPLGVTDTSALDKGIFSGPPSLSPVLLQFDLSVLARADFWGVILTLLFMEVFDGLAGFLGLFTVMGSDAERYRHKLGRAFIADSLGVVVGACAGNSPNTTYAESGAGIAQGGRTGLTSLTVAALFGISLFFSNIFSIIPESAVAPALVMVGLLMMSSVTKLNFGEITETFPAFIIVIFIALTFHLSDGLAVGWILFIIMKLVAGNREGLNPTVYVVGALFLLKFIFM
jgi:AGZA family xanthine/uracil permease-like MFS transporter